MFMLSFGFMFVAILKVEANTTGRLTLSAKVRSSHSIGKLSLTEEHSNIKIQFPSKTNSKSYKLFLMDSHYSLIPAQYSEHNQQHKFHLKGSLDNMIRINIVEN